MLYSYDIVGNRLKTGLPGPDISVVPGSYSFGDVVVGTTSSPVMLTISSVGSESLNVSGMSFTGTDSSMFSMSLSGTNPCPQVPFSLSVHESCTVELTFSPTSPGAKTAALRISTNDPDAPELDVALSGNGLALYTLTVGKTGTGTGTVESLDGGVVCGADCGETYVEGTSVTLTATPDVGSYFDGWTGGGCAGTGDCTLVMIADTLVEASFSPAPHISVTPSTHGYGAVAGGESGSQAFTVANDGQADLEVGSIAVSGVDASEFGISTDSCSSATLQPTESCQFGVTFAPASSGSKVAVAEVPSNDPYTPVYNVSLAGTGSTEPNIRARSVLLKEGFAAGMPALWNSTGAWSTTNPCGRTLDSPFVEPWAVADSLCNSDASGELTTPPLDASTCNTVTLSFTNQFDQYGASQAIVESSPDGQTWTTEETMTADSQYPTAGWKEVDVSGVAGSSSAQIRFVHTAVGEANGYWAVDNVWALCEPPQLQFTGRLMETSAPKSVEVRNEGFSNLVVSSVAVTGTDAGDFSIQSEDCTTQPVAPGGACLVDEVFTASSVGSKSAALSISSDDPDTPTVNVPLSGEGVNGPDLYMIAVSGPTSAWEGDTITVSYTVTADPDGDPVSDAFIIGFYLSTDTVFGSDRRFCWESLNSIQAGESISGEISCRLPDNYAGTRYIIAVADDVIFNDITETDETNNVLTGNQIIITRRLPDFVMKSVSGPASASTGGTITVSDTVSNEGDGTVDFFSVVFWLSTDNVITASDTYIGYRNVKSLPSGGTSSANTTVTIPTSLSPGTYYIGATADPEQFVGETDETNNTAVGNQITITQP
jgi:hypothetical protein